MWQKHYIAILIPHNWIANKWLMSKCTERIDVHLNRNFGNHTPRTFAFFITFSFFVPSKPHNLSKGNMITLRTRLFFLSRFFKSTLVPFEVVHYFPNYLQFLLPYKILFIAILMSYQDSNFLKRFLNTFCVKLNNCWIIIWN